MNGGPGLLKRGTIVYFVEHTTLRANPQKKTRKRAARKFQEGYIRNFEVNSHLLLRSSTRRSLVDTLLECEELFRAECLIMNLSSRFNEVLQMCPREEVTQVHKFTVIGILDIHHAPTVFTTPN